MLAVLQAKLELAQAAVALVGELVPVGTFKIEAEGPHRMWLSNELVTLLRSTEISPVTSYASFLEHMEPEDREPFAALIERLFLTGEAITTRIRMRAKDGTIVWFELRMRTAQRHPGRSPTLVGTMLNVTSSVDQEQERSALRAEMNALLAVIPEGILHMVPVRDEDADDISDYTITSVSAAAEQLLELPRSRILGQRLSNVLPSLTQEMELAALAECLWGGKCRSGTVLHSPGLGPAKHVDYRTRNSVDGLVMALHDSTTEHHLLKRLAHTTRLESLGRLTVGVAKDFNNMLSVILGFGSLVRDGLDETDPHKEEMGELVKAAERAATLARRLASFERTTGGHTRRQPLVPIARHAIGLLERTLGEDITIYFEDGAPSVLVAGSETSLEQLIIGLSLMARDAMPNGGDLTIRISQGLSPKGPDDQHATEPSAVLSLVCTQRSAASSAPFSTPRQSHLQKESLPPTSASNERSAVTLLESLGGRFARYASETGTLTLVAYLPLAERESLPAQGSSTWRVDRRHSLMGRETILLVEDDELVRHLVQRVLTNNGYSVLEASNAGEAILLHEQHIGPIDLLLSDVVMPRVSGTQLTEHIRARSPDLAVLLMSGKPTEEANRLVTNETRVGFLPKPFYTDELLARVRELLDEPTSATALGG